MVESTSNISNEARLVTEYVQEHFYAEYLEGLKGKS